MRVFKTIMPALLALLALLMLGLAISPISAQSDDSGEVTDFSQFEGLQRADARSYTADFMAMFNPATPDAAPSGWFALTAVVLEFDSEENAAAGNERLVGEITGSDITDGTEMQDIELELDFDHTAKQAVEEQEGSTSYILFTTVQDGNYVYAVVGVTIGDEPGGIAAAALITMKTSDAGDGDGTYREDGTSEGGLWDKLPTLEQMQELEPDFIEASDELLFPVPEGTPAV